jgi:hypothetical protein
MASIVAWSCCGSGVPPGKPCMAAAAAAAADRGCTWLVLHGRLGFGRRRAAAQPLVEQLPRRGGGGGAAGEVGMRGLAGWSLRFWPLGLLGAEVEVEKRRRSRRALLLAL